MEDGTFQVSPKSATMQITTIPLQCLASLKFTEINQLLHREEQTWRFQYNARQGIAVWESNRC